MNRKVLYRFYIGKEYGNNCNDFRILEFINVTLDTVICEYYIPPKNLGGHYGRSREYSYNKFKLYYDIDVEELIKSENIKQLINNSK
jgi:hypothetical protein